MLSLEGKQLGNYDVIQRIRVGGMGAVYEGRQRTAFGRRVAIKVILGDYATDADMRRRFAREARTVARLQHPHILPLIEFGDEQSILYLVMPFIDGGTLTSYLRHNLLDLSEVVAIYQQLLDAVEYAHEQGLIHRDIKSSNVLLEQRRSGPPHVYLADFGLVRTSRQTGENPGKTIPLDQIPGTPHYMAPEQTRGIVTPATDIYALGVLLYQMLTGMLPYHDEDDVRVIQMHLFSPIPVPSAQDASIPRELDEVVRMAMAKRPETRYKTIAQLRAAFLAATNGSTIVGSEEVTVREAEKRLPPKRRNSQSLMFIDSQEFSVPPVPAPEPRRPRQAAPMPIVVRERAKEPQRITETVKNRPHVTQRITEEPVNVRRKRSARLWLATMFVPLVLIILLLMPRVLNFSFFPSGFPVFGTPPVAMVYVTAQTKQVQDTYVLTASPAVQVPELATHTIPDRLIQQTLSDTRLVQTTGTKTLAGISAHGVILFLNSGSMPMVFPAQFPLTSTQGVRVQLVQGVVVPPSENGQAGNANADAVAVNAGTSGNIAAHALDGTCCSANVSATNLSPFTGGVDAQTVHVVAQADLDGAQSTAESMLQSKIQQQLQKQLHANESLAGQPSYTVIVSSDNPVGTQSDQVQVTTKLSATAIVYNNLIADHITTQLFSKQEVQLLGVSYQLQGTPSIVARQVVTQGQNGLTYLNVTVRGSWLYVFSTPQVDQWRQSIKGATVAAALAYLNAQTGISAVQIRLPFGADHFPTSIDEIRVIAIVNS